MTYLNLRYNNLKNFPDFTVIAPNIFSLLLSRNPFYLSETSSERSEHSESSESVIYIDTYTDESDDSKSKEKDNELELKHSFKRFSEFSKTFYPRKFN